MKIARIDVYRFRYTLAGGRLRNFDIFDVALNRVAQ